MCEREETEREDEQVNNREGSLAGGGEMVRSRSSQFRPRQKNKIIKRKRKGKGKGKKRWRLVWLGPSAANAGPKLG